MSHYSVLIALPGDTELESLEDVLNAKLERYNENRAVDRYRSYREGDANDFWAVDSLRAEGFLPAEGGVTWPQVVDAYNRKYHSAPALVSMALATEAEPAEEVEDEDDKLHIDPENGKAFAWSTYNPESKWDWWVIGGRWSDHFKIKEVGPGLVAGNYRGVFGKEKTPGTCDGGRVRLLDLDAMRDKAEADANERYDLWEKIVAEHGTIQSWDHLRGMAQLGEIDIQEARRRYNEQPAVRAAEEQHLSGFLSDPVEELFMAPREEYVHQARLAAVPGYAYIDLDGEWHSPGQMGWFGASSDGAGEREAYRVGANAFIDGLDPDTYLIMLDFHI